MTASFSFFNYKKLKILVLHQHYCPENGIGNNRTGEIFEHFHQEFGHEIEIITSRSAFPKNHPVYQTNKIYTFLEKGLKIHVLPVSYSHFDSFFTRIQSFLSYFYQAFRFAKTLEKPDFIYGISTPPSVAELAYRLASKWKIPWFFETVDVWPDVPIGMKILTNPLAIKLLDARVRFLYKQATGIIALSPGMKEQICSHGIDDQKIFVSYNGSNIEQFPFQLREIQEKVHFLYAGTIGKANDISFLLKAVELTKDLPVSYEIIGDGNEAWKVTEFIAQKNPKHLSYHPSVTKNELKSYFSRAHIGIVCFANYPVLEANSANKFYDYLMSGLVVLTNVEGWQKQILDDQYCGKTSKQGDVHAFCEKIAWFCDNKSVLQQMSINGHEFAKAHFDRKKIAIDLESWVCKQLTKVD